MTGVPRLHAARASRSNAKTKAGEQGVELDPSKHPCAETEGDSKGAKCADVVFSGGSCQPLAEVQAYETGAEDFS